MKFCWTNIPLLLTEHKVVHTGILPRSDFEPICNSGTTELISQLYRSREKGVYIYCVFSCPSGTIANGGVGSQYYGKPSAVTCHVYYLYTYVCVYVIS